MNSTNRPFFLLIGANDSDFSTEKLKVSGAYYKRKSLYSHPGNWGKVIDILEDPALTAVLCKLTGRVFNLIADPVYRDVARDLLMALSKKSNLVMVHDSVLADEEEPEGTQINVVEVPDDDDSGVHETYFEYVRSRYLVTPDRAVKDHVFQLLTECGISLIPYSTNAEMVTLAGSFIDDNESNLLFRVYVPSGRLYASEADRLLSLFHDWLTQVGRHSVRQDGYSTAAGRVYEFFGAPELKSQEMSQHFSDFSNFLDLCASDPDAAEGELSNQGLERGLAAGIVTKYGKSVRRINTDLRHERETRMLSIRHRLESDLLEIAEGSVIDASALDAVISGLIPNASPLSPLGDVVVSGERARAIASSVIINQQVFNNLQGTVVQNVQGTVHLGVEAREILNLISEHGGSASGSLETDVHELEDPDARPAERLGAKARLSSFLVRLAGTVEATALGALQKYVEGKLGI